MSLQATHLWICHRPIPNRPPRVYHCYPATSLKTAMSGILKEAMKDPRVKDPWDPMHIAHKTPKQGSASEPKCPTPSSASSNVFSPTTKRQQWENVNWSDMKSGCKNVLYKFGSKMLVPKKRRTSWPEWNPKSRQSTVPYVMWRIRRNWPYRTIYSRNPISTCWKLAKTAERVPLLPLTWWQGCLPHHHPAEAAHERCDQVYRSAALQGKLRRWIRIEVRTEGTGGKVRLPWNPKRGVDRYRLLFKWILLETWAR